MHQHTRSADCTRMFHLTIPCSHRLALGVSTLLDDVAFSQRRKRLSPAQRPLQAQRQRILAKSGDVDVPRDARLASTCTYSQPRKQRPALSRPRCPSEDNRRGIRGREKEVPQSGNARQRLQPQVNTSAQKRRGNTTRPLLMGLVRP